MLSYIAYTYHWVNWSRLIAQIRRFNIGGNRSIVTRYRLGSQSHCSYLESRGVPGKTLEIPGKKAGKYRVKKRGKLFPFHFQFPVHDFRWRSPIRSPTNDNWTVPIYYLSSISPLWTFHLYVATSQQHLHIQYTSLSWYDIPELVVPIRISLIEGCC